MTDGDFGGDGGGHDGGAFDLNDNGTSVDEFLLFAAITDDGERSKGRGETKRAASGCGCLLPAVAVLLLAFAAALA